MKYVMVLGIFLWCMAVQASENHTGDKQYQRALARAAQAKEYLKKKYNLRYSTDKQICRVTEPLVLGSEFNGVNHDGVGINSHFSSLVSGDEEEVLARYALLKKMIEEKYSPMQPTFLHYYKLRGCATGHEVIIIIKFLNNGFLTVPNAAKDGIVNSISQWYGCDRNKAVSFWQEFEQKEKIHPVSGEKIREKICNKYL